MFLVLHLMSTIASTIASIPRYPIMTAYMYILSSFGCPPTHSTPPNKPHFPLDILGVVGVFGGEEAVSAMATVHVYENRRWLGWYTSPGSYQIARRFSLLLKSRSTDSFLPGVHTDPTVLFESDISKGPRFIGAHSGTFIEETGHVASLFMKECAAREGKAVKGRKSQAVGVTIAKLTHTPKPQMCPKRINPFSPIFAGIPIIVSVGTCVACGVFDDWYTFSLIFLGILTSGISCLAIGSANFTFAHPAPLKGCPPGDGVLGSGKEIVLLQGMEGAVNSITRGSFFLSFFNERQYEIIGWCSILLTIQFITQLLLVPKCSPFGQTMFATSLAVSWIYNSWLTSLDHEKIQRDTLLNSVLRKPGLTKYSLGTRTAAAVFILHVLQPKVPSEILNELLPNHTKVWRKWKDTVVRQLGKEKVEFAITDQILELFTEEEISLLEPLYEDAKAGYTAYIEYAASK